MIARSDHRNNRCVSQELLPEHERRQLATLAALALWPPSPNAQLPTRDPLGCLEIQKRGADASSDDDGRPPNAALIRFKPAGWLLAASRLQATTPVRAAQGNDSCDHKGH
jgi:hypothetical protein